MRCRIWIFSNWRLGGSNILAWLNVNLSLSLSLSLLCTYIIPSGLGSVPNDVTTSQLMDTRLSSFWIGPNLSVLPLLWRLTLFANFVANISSLPSRSHRVWLWAYRLWQLKKTCWPIIALTSLGITLQPGLVGWMGLLLVWVWAETKRREGEREREGGGRNRIESRGERQKKSKN